MVMGRIETMVAVLEQEAADGATNFRQVEDGLRRALERKVAAIANAHDLRHYVMPGPRVPMIEYGAPEFERTTHELVAEARALAFARAFLRALAAREVELRAAAFGGAA